MKLLPRPDRNYENPKNGSVECRKKPLSDPGQLSVREMALYIPTPRGDILSNSNYFGTLDWLS